MKTILSLLVVSALTASAANSPMSYRHDDSAFKPYVEKLYTHAGVQMLRDMVPDHKHHHGLMFAVAADGVDFWSENANCGKQIEKKFSATDSGIEQHLEWTAPGGKVLLRETRTVSVESGPVTLLTWRSRLMPASTNAVKLTGATYFGLGARFVDSMNEVSQHVASTGPVAKQGERLTAANWCACVGPVEGKTVTFVMFDAPGNPRHPATMFTMMHPFAYSSATLNLSKEPMVLKEPVELCYGVAALDGEVPAVDIERLYVQWAKGLR